MTIDISTASIIKVLLGGLFTYFIFPAVLVGRDMFLHYIIQKFITNSSLNSLIRICESDRWYLKNRYSKTARAKIGTEKNPSKFLIDDEEVEYKQFQEYVKNKEFHQTRYYITNASISRKHNLIVWLFKHYKQAEGDNPIPSLRDSHYKSAETYEACRDSESNKSSEKDVQTASASS